MNTWLVIDAPYLCYRSFHAMGQLSHEDVPTGMAYGFLREINDLQDRFNTDLVAFCWDVGRPKRLELLPSYKCSRYKRRSEDEDARKVSASIQDQMARLRNILLPKMGHYGQYWEEGYEADDMIAHFRSTINRASEAIIVSADQDLFQLLGPRTMVWNPHKKRMITEDSFKELWGIEPSQWTDVKAIAGCSTDDIPGIKGVGERTAARFLTGKLGSHTKAFKSIVEGDAVWKRNLALVRLPWKPEPKRIKLRRDYVTDERKREVYDELGITRI